MDKKVGIELFVVAIGAICALVLTSGVVSATDIYVGPGETYTTIQSAVTAANPFDTIIVRDDTYTENVDVDVDNVTIFSENGSENCIVQAFNPNDHVFEVTADYVNISGFTVQNATGSGKAGIRLGNADHCTVSNISASNNYYGIDLYESGSNTIMDNIANSNNWHGIRLRDSNYNNLTNNTANLNGIAGIALRASTCNTLINNSVSDNEIGFAVPPDHPINMSYFDNSIDTSNQVNGKPVYTYFNQSNQLIDGLEAGHLSLWFCSNFTLRNVNVSGGDGIFLRGTTNSTITDSISVSNTFGIMVDSSDCNNITDNRGCPTISRNQ
jgi:parallel beta-helix repeat protein